MIKYLKTLLFGPQEPSPLALRRIDEGKAWEGKYLEDPRNKHGVLWHWWDLQQHGFEEEIQKGDWEEAREDGRRWFHELFIAPTEEEIAIGKEVAYGLIEEDDWDHEVHEFDFKSQTVTDPYPGTADKIFVYKNWYAPNVIVVRVRFKFSRGTYDKMESIYPPTNE